MEYTVVGTFKRKRKDCEGETQDCKNYTEAVILQAEWKRSGKYKSVIVVRNDKQQGGYICQRKRQKQY